MIDIKGSYCKDVKIFTDNIENEALDLIYSIANHPVFDGQKIRIMPDVHAGKGIVIGFSCPIPSAVAPAHVGCDIGCSMTSLEFSKPLPVDSYANFEHKVKNVIPTGFTLNAKSAISGAIEKEMYSFMTNEYNKARSAWPEMIPNIGVIDEEYVGDVLNRIGMEPSVFYRSLGTLGGGNHFLEYGESDDGRGFFTIHCGSRNLGVKVFNYWNKIANSNKVSKDDVARITADVKASCNDKTQIKAKLNAALDAYRSKHANGYLYDYNLRGYLSDMVFAQAYAAFNHKMISKRVSDIAAKFGIKIVNTIFTTHNYIDFTDHIIRKGAINASAGRNVIIPFNMRDGIAICRGKGNDDWNCTAPHGAGRIMSRSKAAKTIKLADFEKSMEGIYSTSICSGTLDESPMVYKPMDEIVDLITPTVDILYFIKPKINIKATDGGE